MKKEEALLVVGGLAAVGIVAYFMLAEPIKPLPGEPSAEISEISLH